MLQWGRIVTEQPCFVVRHRRAAAFARLSKFYHKSEMKPPPVGTAINRGKTGKIGELERFENADMESGDSGDSPDVHVPAISAQRLTETILEAAASTDRFRSLNDQVFVTLSVVIGIRNIFHFPALCSKHGGVAFFIPYAFAIGTVGAPLVYLESVFGQYTSLPPLQLFDRLGRAFSGIGLATTMMAVMQAMLLGSSIAVSPVYGAKCLGSLHSAVAIWLSCSFGTRLNSNCYDISVNCGENELQSNSRCYQIFNHDGSINDQYTWEEVVQIITNSSEALRQLPTQIYANEILRPAPYSNDLIMSGATFVNALVAGVAMLGMRTYMKIAKFLVVFPVVIIVFLTGLILRMIGFQRALLSLGDALAPHFGSLLTLRAWTDAIIHVMTSLCVASGMMIVISSMKRFNNNAIRDTVFVIFSDILCTILACLLISPIIGYTASQMYTTSSSESFMYKMSYLAGEWNQLPYTLLPSLFARSGAGLGMLAVLYIAIIVMSLGPQVIALEMIILTVYRAFPDLLHMDERISRKFICAAYLAATFGYAYVAISTKDSELFWETYCVVIPLPFLALLEIIAMIHLYRMPRFIVNMKTMLGKPPSNVWRCDML
uniref:Amino acid transporter n=2 Tax=Parascaris univalens TaxID=6257 RepID=A0A914ZZ35_PARUN